MHQYDWDETTGAASQMIMGALPCSTDPRCTAGMSLSRLVDVLREASTNGSDERPLLRAVADCNYKRQLRRAATKGSDEGQFLKDSYDRRL